MTTDPKGKVTPQPTIVARTVVRGDSARADITEGMGDFRPGAFFLTYDGGHTLYIVYPEKRQYSMVPLDSMGDAVAGAVNRGALKVKLDNVQAGFERFATTDSIGGFRTEQVRISRSFRVTMQVLPYFLLHRLHSRRLEQRHVTETESVAVAGPAVCAVGGAATAFSFQHAQRYRGPGAGRSAVRRVDAGEVE